MAKVTVEYDTNDKSLEVTMDGEKLENVDNISFNCKQSLYDYNHDHDDEEDDEYTMMICMNEKDEEHDYRHVTHIHAAEAQEAISKGLAQAIEEMPDYVTFKSNSPRRLQTRQKIAEYLGKK